MIVFALGVFVGSAITTFALSLAVIAGQSDRDIEKMMRGKSEGARVDGTDG